VSFANEVGVCFTGPVGKKPFAFAEKVGAANDKADNAAGGKFGTYVVTVIIAALALFVLEQLIVSFVDTLCSCCAWLLTIC
jgi:hypothetical protein